MSCEHFPKKAENTTDPKPIRQDLLDAWAVYEQARAAAEAGGWEYDLSMAAADAAKVYYRLNRRERGEDVAKLPIDKRRNK